MLIKDLPLSQIDLVENSRMRADDDQSNLMESIRNHGLFQPVGVMPLPNGRYELIYGTRRYEAIRKLGKTTIPAVILREAISEEDVMTINLQENLNRRDITPWEEGRYYDWFEQRGLNHAEIAARVGRKKSHVERCLTIFRDLPKEFRDKVAGVERKGQNTTIYATGKIPATNAMNILTAARAASLSPKQANQLLDAALKHELNLRQLTAIGEDLRRGKKIGDAIKRVASVRYITVKVPVKEEDYLRFKEDGVSMQSAVISALRSTPEFKGIVQE